MKHIKAFIAGLVLPGFLLPIFLCILTQAGKKEITEILPLHFMPWIWGFWNVLYFAIHKDFLAKDRDARLLIMGAILGLIVATIAVFILKLPEKIGFTGNYIYVPLIVAPIVYALLWRYVVKPLNDLVGLKD